MTKNTAAYKILIENEIHSQNMLENARRGRAQGCCRQSLQALNARERKQSYEFHNVGRFGAIALDSRKAGVINGTTAGDVLPGFVGWIPDAAGLPPAQWQADGGHKERRNGREKSQFDG